MTCAIDVRNVHFQYENFAIEDMSLKLHHGEQKAMVGLNGSGKTTIFKLILGLLEPSAGDIFVLEKKVKRENLWQIRKSTGFLFQNPDDQLFAPTVWEDISFGPRNLDLSEDEVRERVEWSLDFVGMLEYANRPVNQMSHGQAKRVALAGIIAMRPKVLLLDEPFTGLDFPMVKGIVEIIEQLRGEGISVLYTTHNRFFLENWADSVIVLKKGQVVYDGPTDEALSSPTISQEIGDWDRLRMCMTESRERLRAGTCFTPPD